jgi:hypothetical protein
MRRRRIHVCHMRRRTGIDWLIAEEDTCMSYEEEEDTCMSYEEEDRHRLADCWHTVQWFRFRPSGLG